MTQKMFKNDPKIVPKLLKNPKIQEIDRKTIEIDRICLFLQ